MNEEVFEMIETETELLTTIYGRKLKSLCHIIRNGEYECLRIQGLIDGKKARRRQTGKRLKYLGK